MLYQRSSQAASTVYGTSQYLLLHVSQTGLPLVFLNTQSGLAWYPDVPGRAQGSGRRYQREKRLGALVLRLTSEVGTHNKIQSDRTNHRSPTGEIGGFDWTYGNWLSNELISLTPRTTGPTGGPLSLIGLPIVSHCVLPLFPLALISDEAISSAVEQSCSVAHNLEWSR